MDAILSWALPHADLETARSLFATKWWDYRFIHPGYGFFLFADIYAKEVENWRSRFGVNPYATVPQANGPIFREETGRKRKLARTTVKPTEPEEKRLILAPPAQRTAMWRAMSIADAHGIPYDRFVALGMAHAFDSQWGRLPLPHHLYSTTMVQGILARWEAEQADLIRLPTDPLFSAPAYQGHPWQTAQQRWLMDLIAARPNPVIPLAQYLARERRLVPSLAVQRFGVSVVRDAIERARR